MMDEKDVFGPWKVAGILSAANNETVIRPKPRRSDQKRIEGGLPVIRIGSEIGQRSARSAHPISRTIGARIDAAVERGHAPRPEPPVQRGQRRSSGVAEHQIEWRKPAGSDVADGLAG